MRALEVETHLTLEEVEEIYRTAKTPTEQRRAHLIMLRLEGVAPSQVAHLLRIRPSTVSETVRRYNERGPDCLRDARCDNPGRPPLLDETAREVLNKVLQSPPPDGGRWSGPKVARWMEKYLQREDGSIQDAMGWRMLRALNMTYKSSRRRHTNSASEEEREQWKKKTDPST